MINIQQVILNYLVGLFGFAHASLKGDEKEGTGVENIEVIKPFRHMMP